MSGEDDMAEWSDDYRAMQAGPALDEAHYPDRAPEPSPLEAAITNMDRSVSALLLEVPPLVYEDVQDRWTALRKLIRPPS